MERFISQYPDLEIAVPLYEQRSRRLFAGMDFHRNLEELFPYINREISGAKMYRHPSMVIFRLEANRIRLYPDTAVSGPFEKREHAHALAQELMDWFNDIHARRDQISPNHDFVVHTAPTRILRILPKNNCGQCGHKTCMAFAAFVSRNRVDISTCPHLAPPIASKQVYPVMDDQGAVVSTVELDVPSRPSAGGKPSQRKLRAGRRALAVPDKEGQFDGKWPFGDNQRLTRRELEVLALVAEGYTNKEICQDLEISAHTVKSHVDHIFNKLGVFDRTQAAVWAVRHNLL